MPRTSAVSTVPTKSRPLPRLDRAAERRPALPTARLAPLFIVVLAAIAAWWTWRALHDPQGYDMRLAYKGGQVAWATGHPEDQSTWTGTPLLAAGLALLTRAASLRTVSGLLTITNLLLTVAAIGAVMWRLRDRLSPAWWWLTALALVSFGPMMSTVWWKQFNVIALVLALAGFDALRGGRRGWAAALMGLSIAIKPLVFLLPLVLAARRETRRVGVLALAWVAGLSMAAQAFLALRAHQLAVLNPVEAVKNFVDKSQPGSHPWACHPLNFGPTAQLCRLLGRHGLTLQHIAVWLAIALAGVAVILVLRGRRATSWEVFAFVCVLSVMPSPLAWSHYQIMLAPLFVLLLVRYTREGASVLAWLGLATAFVLASLMWEPYGTWIDPIAGLLRAHPLPDARRIQDDFTVTWIAQFAQYVLLITAVGWYAARSVAGSAARRVPAYTRAG